MVVFYLVISKSDNLSRKMPFTLTDISPNKKYPLTGVTIKKLKREERANVPTYLHYVHWSACIVRRPLGQIRHCGWAYILRYRLEDEQGWRI